MSNEAKKSIGIKLFLAWSLAIQNGYISLAEQLKEIIFKFNIPEESCNKCGKNISFFKFHLNQGYCDRCTNRMIKSMEKENNLEREKNVRI